MTNVRQVLICIMEAAEVVQVLGQGVVLVQLMDAVLVQQVITRMVQAV